MVFYPMTTTQRLQEWADGTSINTNHLTRPITSWRHRRPRHVAAAHAHARETHLATQYPRHYQLLHTQTRDPSCRRRRLLDLHCPAQLRCSTALAFTVHRYLIYSFLQNLIQCLWISKSKNLCLWTCGVCVFTDEWWTDVGDLWLWI